MIRSAALAVVALAAAGPSAAPSPPRFEATVAPIPPSLRAHMTSWQPGCPVAVSQLRLLTVSFHGFDGRVHDGHLVVSRGSVHPVLTALRRIFEAGFPIRRMRLVEAYGADDDRSMAADNTSAFNCRRIPGSRTWSEHAYGRAVDVNPLENPEVRGGAVSPPGGRAYLDRSRRGKGMIRAGDAVVGAFAAVGWEWGGSWRSLKDYQHFSATGR